MILFILNIVIIAPSAVFACSDGLSSYQRSDNKTICVTEKTADMLIERGWNITHVSEIILTLSDELKVIHVVPEKDIAEDKIHLIENLVLDDSIPLAENISKNKKPMPSNPITTQIQEPKDEIIESSDFTSCHSGKHSAILESFDLSDPYHIGASWWEKEGYEDASSAIVCVVDPDMNLNPHSKDSFDISVWSTSDTNKISITVTETSKTSMVFGGHVVFTDQDKSSGNKLKVLPKDKVYVNYEDNTLPQPYKKHDGLDIVATSYIGSKFPNFR